MSYRYFVLNYENERLDETIEFFGEAEAKKFEDSCNALNPHEDCYESGRKTSEIKKENDEGLIEKSFGIATSIPSIELFLRTKEKAIKFALEKHEGQSYGVLPYITHLNHVFEVAKRLGTDPNYSKLYQEILIACLLHDTIEDTDATFEELETLFSKNVAVLVDAVSLPDGMEREEGYKEVYNKIKANPAAAVVKVADRIANLEASLYERPDKLKKYASEMDEFNKTIFSCIGDSSVRDSAVIHLNALYEKMKRDL